MVYKLHHNQPNPFNPTTLMRYDIPAKKTKSGQYILKARHTKINVYNLRGRLLKTLVSKKKKPGYYKVMWHGTTNTGRQVASGIYIYRIETGNFVMSKKMTLMK